jgi:predicted ATPase with chaperone activity
MLIHRGALLVDELPEFNHAARVVKALPVAVEAAA